MPTPAGARRAPVVFHDTWRAADTAEVTVAGRRVAEVARRRFEHDGVAVGELRRCDAKGRDGTRLGGCFKTYLGEPEAGRPGRYGDRPRAGPACRPVVLLCLAFGVRHPNARRRMSVYRVAHLRLHGG